MIYGPAIPRPRPVAFPLLLAAGWLVIFGGAWVGIYLPTLRLITIGLAAVVLLTWLAAMRRNPRWRPRSFLLPWLLLAMASLAISTVFSRVQRISLEYLGYAIVLAALYLLLVRMMATPEYRRRLVGLAIVLFFVISVTYIGLSIAHWVSWWSTLGRFEAPPLRPAAESLTYGNPSEVLTVVALLAIPTSVAAIWWGRRLLGFAVVVGIVAVVALISGSRGGWFGLAIAAVALGFLAIKEGGGVAAARRALMRPERRRRIRLAGVGLIAAAVVGAALAPGILQRVAGGGESLRASYVSVSLRLFAEAPVIGTGPGSWVVQRARYTQATEPDTYVPHAHDIYVQTLAELGLVGAIAGVLLGVGLFRLLRGAIRDPSPSRRLWGFATTVGLVYFAAHQVLDFYPNMPAVLFLAALPLAYLDATAPATERRSIGDLVGPRLARISGPIAVLVVGIALAGLTVQEVPATRADRAVTLANAGDWMAADADARAAAEIDPAISSYVFTAALTAAHNGDHATAADLFELVARRDDLSEAWLNLAAELLAAGSTEGVAEALAASLRLGIQRAAVAMPAGDLALRLGDEELAVDAFTAALIAIPSLAADEWWHADPVRSATFERALVEASSRQPDFVLWELHLMAGDWERALAVATDDVTRDFMLGWTGDEAARLRLLDRCEREFPGVRLVSYCARLEARAGNDDAAARYRAIAGVQGGGLEGTTEVRIVAAVVGAPRMAGNPATYWGAYTYRRFTPWDMLVPSVVHLEFQ